MEIVKIKNNKDGSALVSIILTEQEEERFKEIAKTRKKKFSKKFIETYLIEMLHKEINKSMSSHT